MHEGDCQAIPAPNTRLIDRGPVAQLVPVANPKRPQAIAITPCLNGYTVHVGCQSVVFETLNKMLSEIDRYMRNPSQVEREYLEQK